MCVPALASSSSGSHLPVSSDLIVKSDEPSTGLVRKPEHSFSTLLSGRDSISDHSVPKSASASTSLHGTSSHSEGRTLVVPVCCPASSSSSSSSSRTSVVASASQAKIANSSTNREIDVQVGIRIDVNSKDSSITTVEIRSPVVTGVKPLKAHRTECADVAQVLGGLITIELEATKVDTSKSRAVSKSRSASKSLVRNSRSGDVSLPAPLLTPEFATQEHSRRTKSGAKHSRHEISGRPCHRLDSTSLSSFGCAVPQMPVRDYGTQFEINKRKISKALLKSEHGIIVIDDSQAFASVVSQLEDRVSDSLFTEHVRFARVVVDGRYVELLWAETEALTALMMDLTKRRDIVLPVIHATRVTPVRSALEGSYLVADYTILGINEDTGKECRYRVPRCFSHLAGSVTSRECHVSSGPIAYVNTPAAILRSGSCKAVCEGRSALVNLAVTTPETLALTCIGYAGESLRLSGSMVLELAGYLASMVSTSTNGRRAFYTWMSTDHGISSFHLDLDDVCDRVLLFSSRLAFDYAVRSVVIGARRVVGHFKVVRATYHSVPVTLVYTDSDMLEGCVDRILSANPDLKSLIHIRDWEFVNVSIEAPNNTDDVLDFAIRMKRAGFAVADPIQPCADSSISKTRLTISVHPKAALVAAREALEIIAL
ncbi:MAG: uncharacterized protein KVP18_003046 [Porospora cf. gigantea A]|uniref:uncharacterized protein n=1 Tax=Porospora cf. gigantea A TaxID=2853593 RepID=UPI003559B2F1|nr:MAG: hypothetical protein KVP18_003046 [Porospora cf. gigantea A]